MKLVFRASFILLTSLLLSFTCSGDTALAADHRVMASHGHSKHAQLDASSFTNETITYQKVKRKGRSDVPFRPFTWTRTMHGVHFPGEFILFHQRLPYIQARSCANPKRGPPLQEPTWPDQH